MRIKGYRRIVILSILLLTIIALLVNLVIINNIEKREALNNSAYNDSIDVVYIDSTNITLAEFKQLYSSIIKNEKYVSITNPNEQAYRPYRASEAVKRFIKNHESLSLTEYQLAGEKFRTIGYGHYCDSSEDEKIPSKISKAYADMLFNKDIDDVNKSVNNLLNDLNPNFKFNQGFIDAMVDLVYNAGEANVRNSPLYKRLKNCRFDKNGNVNKKDLDYSLVAIKSSCISSRYAKNHRMRRSHEYKMILN